MTSRRMVLLVTGLAVAGLGGVFAAVQWDRANQIATLASALAAVAALGVAVWAALPSPGRVSTVRASRTGKATANAGGAAVSGVSGPAGSTQGQVEVADTGDADASGGGDAISGIHLT